MSVADNQKPEQQREQPLQQPPAAANGPDSAADLVNKNFQEELGKKREAHEEKIKEQQKKFRQTGSIGKDKVEMLTARQINRLRDVARAKESRFASLLREQKSSHLQAILGEAEAEMMAISEPYGRIIDYVRGLDKLDEREMVRLEAIMEAMSKMKANPQLEKIFQKALGRSSLADEELQYLVDGMTPLTIRADLEDGAEKADRLFEAGQLGAVVSVLKDGPQFMQLLELIVQKKEPGEAAAILDVFLTVGVVSNLQVQSLLDRGLLHGPAAEELRRKLDGGEIVRRQKEYQDMAEEMARKNASRTAENPMSKVVSGPTAMALAGLWGVAVALANIKAGWQSGNGIAKNLADAATNPYVLGGLAVAAGGALVAAPVAAPETFGKYRDKFLDFWKGPEERREALNIRSEQLKKMLEAELSRNLHLLNFLEEKDEFPGGRHLTGLEVVQAMVEEQRSKNQDVSFKFSELLSRCGGRQKAHLEKSFTQLGGKEHNFTDSIRAVMAALTQLKLNTPDAFASFAREIKSRQGIK
jgi:hypothetical protein